MTRPLRTGRLSTLAAAAVVARRDMAAILFSRSFIFFLLGPLLLVAIGALAGGVGQEVKQSAERPQLGLAMSSADNAAMQHAQRLLAPQLGRAIPELVVLPSAPGQPFDPAAALGSDRGNLAAIVTGTLEHPVLTGPAARIGEWQGRVALLAAQAQQGTARFPAVALAPVASSRADLNNDRRFTAQIGQAALFSLTLLLAGMVLSNLVEEKGNKVIEVLAAAIPMDAVFLGKLFAMLAVSWLAITVWALVLGPLWLAAGHGLADYAPPAVGWPAFIALGMVYFSLAYLLLGSIFLAIGSLATTVREVQTLSMPVTMLQLLTFYFASFAMARPGTTIELAALVVPFSSPFMMVARAAQDERLWLHAAAIGWQVLCVAVLVRAGATLFRQRVMHSGPARPARRRWFARRTT